MTSAPAQKDSFIVRLGRFLLTPWAIVISMVLGALVGIYYREFAKDLAPFGQNYLRLLQMCILPVLITAVSSSLGGVVRSHGSTGYLKKMVVVLLIFLLGTSMLGLLGGMIGRPGVLSEQTQQEMGQMISQGGELDMEINFYGENKVVEEAPSYLGFMNAIIPGNIFSALAGSKNLQVLFFAIILGLAVGTIRPQSADNLIGLLDSIYQAFSKIICWAMYLLPFGMFCLMAVQVSQIGMGTLVTMAKFILVFYVCGILLFIVNTIIIWRSCGRSLWETLCGVKEPIIIALGTRSSLATIPSAISALDEELGFDAAGTKLTLPLGITIGRFGNVMFFALAAVFVAQLYDAEMSVTSYIILVICSILAGMATSGATGVLTLTMLVLVLEPLSLPFGAAWVLFMAVDPIVDPIRTLSIVYPSCAITSLVAAHKDE